MDLLVQLVNYESWKRKWRVSGNACVNQAKDIVIHEDRIEELVDKAKNEMVACIECPLTLEPVNDPCIDDYGISYEHAEIKRWFEATKKQISPCNNKPVKNLYPNAILKVIQITYTAYLEGRGSLKSVGEVLTCPFTGRLMKDPVMITEDMPREAGLIKYGTYSKKIIPQMLEMFDCNSFSVVLDGKKTWIVDTISNLSVKGMVENYKKLLLYEFCRERIAEQKSKPASPLRLTLTLPENEEKREAVYISEASPPSKKKRKVTIKKTKKTTKKRKCKVTYQDSDTDYIPSDADDGVIVLDDSLRTIDNDATTIPQRIFQMRACNLKEYVHPSMRDCTIELKGLYSTNFDEFNMHFRQWFDTKIVVPLSALTELSTKLLLHIFCGTRGSMNYDVTSELTSTSRNRVLENILFKTVYDVYIIPYSSKGIYYDLGTQNWKSSEFVTTAKTKYMELHSYGNETWSYVFDRGTSLFIKHIRQILDDGILTGVFNMGTMEIPRWLRDTNGLPIFTSPWMDEDGNVVSNSKALEYKKSTKGYYCHEPTYGEERLMSTAFLIHHPLLRDVLVWEDFYLNPKYLLNNVWFLKLIERAVKFNCLMKGEAFCKSISEEYYRKVFGKK